MVNQYLYNKLSAITPKVYPDFIPMAVEFPAIMLELIETNPEHYKGGTDVTYQRWCVHIVATTVRERNDLALEVREALEHSWDYDYNVADCVLVDESSDYDKDVEMFITVLTFDVRVQNGMTGSGGGSVFKRYRQFHITEGAYGDGWTEPDGMEGDTCIVSFTDRIVYYTFTTAWTFDFEIMKPTVPTEFMLTDSNELESEGSYYWFPTSDYGRCTLVFDSGYADFLFNQTEITFLQKSNNVFNSLQTGTNHIRIQIFAYFDRRAVKIINEMGSGQNFNLITQYL